MTRNTAMDLEAWKRGGRSFRYAGYRIFFHQEGQGADLLVIHGFPTSSWDWNLLWPELTQHFRTLACDMIGFGLSAKPQGYPYSITDQATLQESLCASLGVTRVVILCHDYGCAVTQELLARDIDRRNKGESGLEITGICMLNGGLFPEAHRAMLAQKLGMSPLGPVLAKLTTDKMFARSLREVFAPDTRPSREEMRNLVTLAAHDQGLRVLPGILAYVKEREQNRRRWVGALQRSPVPLRFVNGAADPVSGKPMADRYQELIPNPDLVRLDGVGHYPQLEAPQPTWKHIAEFFARVCDRDLHSASHPTPAEPPS